MSSLTMGVNLMRKPRTKEVRDLLNALTVIQNLVGQAKAGYLNVITSNRWNKAVPPLDKIFSICVEIKGKYILNDVHNE